MENTVIGSQVATRGYVPEDATHELYGELYERLVHIPSSRREAVIKALAAVYEIKL